MYKKILPSLLLLFFCFQNAHSKINWLNSLEKGKKVSLALDKLIIVDFWATWCGPCKMMDRDSWSKESIVDITKNFVPVKLDLEKNSRLAIKYNIRSIPNILIMNANGDVIYQSTGYLNEEDLKKLLLKFSLSTKFLKRQSLNYFKHKNYVTTLRLADSYLDYSLFLKEEEPRRGFLNIANSYLKEAEKLLDKEQANYEVMKEKISLLNLVVDLHNYDFRKVNRKISKLNLEKIDSKNKKIFYYLMYAKELGLNDKANKWKKLLLAENGNEYLKKTELLFKETN